MCHYDLFLKRNARFSTTTFLNNFLKFVQIQDFYFKNLELNFFDLWMSKSLTSNHKIHYILYTKKKGHI